MNPPDPAVSKPTEIATAQKKAGIIRKSAIILVLVLIVLVALAFPFVIEPWIVGKIKSTLAAQGYLIDKDSSIDLSFFGGRMNAEKLKISQEYKGKTDEVFSANSLVADVAVIDSLTSLDLIVDHLVIDGMTANLRRRPDGTVPVIPPPEDGKGVDWSKVDWKKYYEKYQEWRKQKKEEQKKQEEEQKKDPSKKPKPTPEKAPDWDGAVVYEPAPSPAGPKRRVLIRDLKINGKSLGLPDETAFDIASFDVVGSNVAMTLREQEEMKLTAKIETTGAGPIDLDLQRLAGTDGSLDITAAKLPIEALANEKIAGDEVAKYGATGFDNLALSTQWQGEDLKGELTHELTKFKLKPTSDAGSEAQQAAQIVNGMGDKPIVWPMKIGGTTYAPKITDSGVDDLVKANAKDAVKGAVKQKATEEAEKVLEKQGAKSGATKKATDLLKGLGK